MVTIKHVFPSLLTQSNPSLAFPRLKCITVLSSPVLLHPPWLRCIDQPLPNYRQPFSHYWFLSLCGIWRRLPHARKTCLKLSLKLYVKLTFPIYPSTLTAFISLPYIHFLNGSVWGLSYLFCSILS